ncbi:MAG: D-aminoacyl-tRNA deacylase [Treponema sp.]|jgi:D-tyrosyl-tRNA(Tyr) deacylase|nr:D-aminoacyl-tRNA deacylase [Treponema sp.]
MKAVVQRVTNASVSVSGVQKGSIGYGLLAYLGVARDDTAEDALWLAEKIVNLRILDDSDGKMNLSLLDIVNPPKPPGNINNVNRQEKPVNAAALDVNRENRTVNKTPVGVLAVSQFTLLGDARKGRRPSWEKAAPPEKARELYQYFIEKIREKAPCESGEFQARMEVKYANEGPVTILLDSKEK